MRADGFVLFDTDIGRCGVVWHGSGIVGVRLPEESEQTIRERIGRRYPAAREIPVPEFVRSAVDGIVALVAGRPSDLSMIALDMTGVPSFHRSVYELARTIPPGQTLTYGQVANRIGAPESARAVGQALGRNPFAIVVPCHRVVAAGGRTGGFSASGGVATKLRLLAIERRNAPAPATLFNQDFDQDAGQQDVSQNVDQNTESTSYSA